jgi:hypothetical protein
VVPRWAGVFINFTTTAKLKERRCWVLPSSLAKVFNNLPPQSSPRTGMLVSVSKPTPTIKGVSDWRTLPLFALKRVKSGIFMLYTEGVSRQCFGDISKERCYFCVRITVYLRNSRLGIWKPEVNIKGKYTANVTALEQSSRTYELTNHLGNVLGVISDKGGCYFGARFFSFWFDACGA